jgi:hypothetical protein
MNNLVLMIGNDINNISKGQSWRDLLQEIVDFCQVCDTVDLDDKKPFPLLYEEVFLTAIRKTQMKERTLKTFIAEKTMAIAPNPLHRAIRELQPADVLTTNYEFTLEGCIPEKHNSLISERYFSIFRKYQINDTNYWHVHGDCLNPMSINLGFEHYGGQLQQMRNYVVSGTFYSNPKVSKLSLLKRIKKGQIDHHSWLDLFFTKDIHIFGLSLDFVETDLWWLLTYRARQKFQRNTIPVDNHIYYYIPAELTSIAKFKLDMLSANDVQVIPITAMDKAAYYHTIIERIGQQ